MGWKPSIVAVTTLLACASAVPVRDASSAGVAVGDFSFRFVQNYSVHKPGNTLFSGCSFSMSLSTPHSQFLVLDASLTASHSRGLTLNRQQIQQLPKPIASLSLLPDTQSHPIFTLQ